MSFEKVWKNDYSDADDASREGSVEFWIDRLQRGIDKNDDVDISNAIMRLAWALQVDEDEDSDTAFRLIKERVVVYG